MSINLLDLATLSQDRPIVFLSAPAHNWGTVVKLRTATGPVEAVIMGCLAGILS